MNLKNLAMWAVIVFLTIGLYNMFKNPQGTVSQKNNIILLFCPTCLCGFLNMLYKPIVKKTITAHMAKFLRFMLIK